MDLGNSEARYLRDVELQSLLQKLVDKEVFITVVLDCCHAGAVTRGMKLDLQHCTLITACSGWEYARERTFDAGVTHGALTYWLLDSLRRTEHGFTYKMLHDRLLAKVLGEFAGQTPQLQGNANREIFGALERPIQNGVTVIHVQPGEILLNAGRAHGLVRGAQFSVFQLFEPDISCLSNNVAIVEITQTEPTTCKAKIVSCLYSEAIEPGAQAVLVDPGQELRRSARLTSGINGATVEDLAALKKVEQLLAQTCIGYVSLANNDDRADYVVTVNMDGEFIICDDLGKIIPNLKPSLLVRDSTAPYRLVERLVHLTKYLHVSNLSNKDPSTILKGALLTDISPQDKMPDERHGARSLTSDEINVNNGDWVCLRVRNNFPAVMNITALELRPDWTIKQIYPTDATPFEPLDRAQEILLSLPMTLPEPYESGRKTIKVFATFSPTSFRCLELAPLECLKLENCKPLVAGVLSRLKDINRGGINPLTITTESSAVRGISLDMSSCADWIVQELRIQIQSQYEPG